MNLSILDDTGPQCHITTVADLMRGYHPVPQHHAEHWPMKRTPVPAHERRAVHGPAIPAGLFPPRPPASVYTIIPSTVELDEDWDKNYTTKFSTPPDPDEPMVTPRGTAAALRDFEDPITELNFLIETQHLELATDYQTLIANKFSATDISTIDVAAGRTAPYVVRIKDDVMKTDDGEEVCVPRYANMTYIANMLRRIDWERWRAQNGPLHRARFTPTKDGQVGIVCFGKHETAEELMEHKLALLRYYDNNKWPYPEAHECFVYDKKQQHRLGTIEPRLTEEQYDAYIKSKMYGTEDDDPWRRAFHAEPNPRPTRGQYAYGDHRRCRLMADDQTVKHNGCTEDGDELYRLDLQTWLHAVPEDEVGYAGPQGYLYSDADEMATPDRQVTPERPWLLTVHGLDEDETD